MHRANKVQDGAERTIDRDGPEPEFRFASFGPSGSFPPIPTALNNRGEVTGFGQPPIIGPLSFLYSNGTFSVLNSTHSNSAFDINDRGQLVGNYQTGNKVTGFVSHGFIYSGGTLTLIDAPNAEGTSASGINNRAVIVGSFSDSLGQHGFLDNAGAFTTIDAPNADATQVSTINNRGEVAGTYQDSAGTHGFVEVKGHFASFDAPNSTSIQPFEINDRGEVAGSYRDISGDHGFVYAHGKLVTIDVPGATSTDLRGINNRGELVGFYSDDTGEHGFVSQRGHFANVDAPGATDTKALAINDRGQVAGTYQDGTGGHAFIATETGKSIADVGLKELLCDRTSNITLSDFLPSALAMSGSLQAAGPQMRGLWQDVAAGSSGNLHETSSAPSLAVSFDGLGTSTF